MQDSGKVGKYIPPHMRNRATTSPPAQAKDGDRSYSQAKYGQSNSRKQATDEDRGGWEVQYHPRTEDVEKVFSLFATAAEVNVEELVHASYGHFTTNVRQRSEYKAIEEAKKMARKPFDEPLKVQEFRYIKKEKGQNPMVLAICGEHLHITVRKGSHGTSDASSADRWMHDVEEANKKHDLTGDPLLVNIEGVRAFVKGDGKETFRDSYTLFRFNEPDVPHTFSLDPVSGECRLKETDSEVDDLTNQLKKSALDDGTASDQKK